MKYIISLFFLTTLCAAPLLAQKKYGNSDGVTLADFKGEFSIRFSQDSKRSFYAVNMGDLKGEAARVYFMEAVYKQDRVVSISKPDANGIWYLSTLRNANDQEIRDLLFQLREESNVYATNAPNAKKDKLVSESKKLTEK